MAAVVWTIVAGFLADFKCPEKKKKRALNESSKINKFIYGQVWVSGLASFSRKSEQYCFPRQLVLLNIIDKQWTRDFLLLPWMPDSLATQMTDTQRIVHGQESGQRPNRSTPQRRTNIAPKHSAIVHKVDPQNDSVYNNKPSPNCRSCWREVGLVTSSSQVSFAP